MAYAVNWSCHTRELLGAYLLLLLLDRPASGYDLITQLAQLGFEDVGSGLVYQELERLCHAGLVRVSWKPAAAGSSSRVYGVTPAGRNNSARYAKTIAQRTAALDAFLVRYHGVSAGLALALYCLTIGYWVGR
jgi:DNA-binding PadR family transcriptional regulator